MSLPKKLRSIGVCLILLAVFYHFLLNPILSPETKRVAPQSDESVGFFTFTMQLMLNFGCLLIVASLVPPPRRNERGGVKIPGAATDNITVPEVVSGTWLENSDVARNCNTEIQRNKNTTSRR